MSRLVIACCNNTSVELEQEGGLSARLTGGVNHMLDVFEVSMRYMAKDISDLQQVHRPGGWHDVERHLIVGTVLSFKMTRLVMSDNFKRTQIKILSSSRHKFCQCDRGFNVCGLSLNCEFIYGTPVNSGPLPECLQGHNAGLVIVCVGRMHMANHTSSALLMTLRTV
ncbi:uncharacterized protein BJ212DRAFT_1590842 [Suillus subaureus]|uniref:Uncharacterized protein n=1 Tax=Suillus subaureus TaxID=48587 RepID=A0A9P7J6A9_9AGAM|nr:uncharacterized protein BJ212DRAFT_1590842 [Suillus subaureus]KAG1805306.1 hypothetical protein BJ212DRAFT_1590842 [Suillus subaureus]